MRGPEALPDGETREALRATEWSEQQIRQGLALLTLARPDYGALRILDFGCQHGDLVVYLRERGIDAWGFDLGEATDEGPIRRRPEDDYRLPWPDGCFDVVVSHHVWEHVTILEEAVRELHRVTRPGGVGVHAFPARFRLFEAHFLTPLGGVLPFEPWLRLWAFRKKQGREHLTSREYAREGAAFIRELWYPGWSEIEQVFRPFSVSNVAGPFARIIMGRSWIPGWLISTFHLRVIRTVRP